MKTFKRNSILKVTLLALVAVMTLAACGTQSTAAPIALSAQEQAANIVPVSTRNLELGQALFTGKISLISADSVTVDKMVFRTDGQTLRSASLAVGNPVNVKALVLPDNTRYALEINPAVEDSGSSSSSSNLGEVEFKLYGIVETMGSSAWAISGNSISVDSSTSIEAGLAIGSIVEVEGRVVSGSLLASEIKSEDSLGSGTAVASTPEVSSTSQPSGSEVEFTASLVSINGSTWLVGERSVVVTASTEIKDNPQVGSLVKVHATLQADGNYLAREIEAGTIMDTSATPGAISTQTTQAAVGTEIEFFDTVASINGNTWMIGNRTVLVNSFTEIKDNVGVGSYVKVHASPQADGSFLAREIRSGTK
jgi:hypothetical protein